MASKAPIRAIAARFHADFSRAAFEKILEGHPFEHCAIISPCIEPAYFRGIAADRQQWFVSAQIRNCEYAGVDWETLEPIDEELIVRMRECEATFMEMVSRLEWKRIVPYATRKRWYLRHLRFWNDYITRHRINLFLSAWIPHEIPDYIIYELCKLRKIPVVYLGLTSIRDTSFVEHDWEKSAEQLGERYAKLIRQYAPDHDPLSIPLAERFDRRYRALVHPEGEVPSIEEQDVDFSHGAAVKRLLRNNPFALFPRALAYLTPQGIARALRAVRRRAMIREARDFYDARVITPNLSVPFVYMPLNFQPEATTVPQAGGYADLVLMAQLLHATLPDDVLLYVKEHPRPSSAAKRSVDFYRDFAAIPRVRFMPRSFDTFALREHCRAVVTTAGTAGFEAPFRGKPVFLFGHTFYQYAPGAHMIRTLDDCRKAVHAIFVDGKKPTPLQCRVFLKAVEETCVHGVLDPWCFNVSHLSVEENAQHCSEAILQDLRPMFGG